MAGGRSSTTSRLPAWYRAALFNELYFLVDGGTFWEAGEVGGAEPEPDDPGRFALLECLDYRFYDTVDVDFYASAAMLELWPELERRGIRDLLATVARRRPDARHGRGVGRRRRRARTRGRCRTTSAAPTRTRSCGRTATASRTSTAGSTSRRSSRSRCGATSCISATTRWSREARPIVEASLRRARVRDRDGDGLPDHAGLPDQTYDTWPMHGPSAYGGLLWLGALRAAEELARADGGRGGCGRVAAAYRGGAGLVRGSRLWRDGYYAYDDGGAVSSDSVMADQLAGQWYADLSGLGDLVDPARIREALRTVHARNVVDFGDGLLGAVNGMRPDRTVDTSSEQSQEVWVGTTYALAALMLGRGLETEAWETAAGAAKVTYERGLWFRTPEAYDRDGNYRASLYLRPLAIWAIEEARRRASRAAG